MKVSQLAGAFNELANREEKIIAEIEALKASLVDAEIPVEAQEALARLSALVATADDLNPDVEVADPNEPV